MVLQKIYKNTPYQIFSSVYTSNWIPSSLFWSTFISKEKSYLRGKTEDKKL